MPTNHVDQKNSDTEAGGATIAMSPPVLPPEEPDFRRELDQYVLESFRPILWVVSLLFVAFALNALRFPKSGTSVAAVFLAASGVTIVAAVVLSRWRPASGLAHPIALAIVLFVVGVLSTVMVFFNGPRDTPNILILLVASGFLFVSLRWLLLGQALLVGSWIALALVHGASTGRTEEWVAYRYFMVTAPAVGILIHTVNVRRLKQLIGLRIKSEDQAERSRTMLDSLKQEVASRELAEATLRESQRRHTKAEQTAHFGHWERMLGEDTAFWSREIYRIFGVDPSSFTPTEEAFFSLLRPADRPRIREILRAARHEKQPADIEYTIVRPDGTERVIHSVADVRLDAKGRPVSLVGTIHDITQRKRAEEALGLIIEATSPTVGEEFLQSLVRNLARALRVRFAFISEIEDAAAVRVRLLALWDRTHFAEVFSYETKDTPCEHVFAKGPVCFSEGVQEKFPNDHWMVENGIEGYLATPLYRADGEPVGHLGVMHDAPLHDDLPRESILKLFAARAGAEMERKHAEERLLAEQRSLEQLLRAHERDRRLIAYEIHDGLAQYATAAIMHLDAFGDRRSASNPHAEKEFARARQLIADLAREARALISGLRPPIIDEQGIVAAIEFLVNEHTVSENLEIEFVYRFELERLEPLLQGTIYRIAQEALSNVKRHSGASKASVTLIQCDGNVQLEVKDWGCGFDPDCVAAGHFGLEGIRERARILRGSALIESSPGEGTRVFVELPISLARDGDDSRPAEK